MSQHPPSPPDTDPSEGTAFAISVLAARGRTDAALALLREVMRRAPAKAVAEVGARLAMTGQDFALCRLCLDWIQSQATPVDTRRLQRLESDLALWQWAATAMQPREGPVAPVGPDRLCYVLHNALPFSSGGYATRGHGLAQGLAGAGWDVQCVTRPGYPMDITGRAADEITDREVIDGIPYHRIKTPERSGLPVWDYILAAADRQTEMLRRLRPARVLAASDFTTALPALIAARRCGIPFAYEVRGLWEITEISHNPVLEASDHFHHRVRMETLTATGADHVFTLTEPLRAELIRRGVQPGRISLAPNSCDPSRFRPLPRDRDLAARYGFPEGVPVIGYIGSFVQYEGLDHLVQACAILRAQGVDFRLLLVGDEHASGQGAGPLTKEIESLLRDGHLTERTVLTGRIPHAAVAAHYGLIDIAPFPRKPQPVTEMVSPLKPLEAMAMERAVVVSSVAALAEQVRDGETGLIFAKGDIGDLARSLRHLITDPALCAKLGRAGRRWVTAHRSWEDTAAKISTRIREI